MPLVLYCRSRSIRRDVLAQSMLPTDALTANHRHPVTFQWQPWSNSARNGASLAIFYVRLQGPIRRGFSLSLTFPFLSGLAFCLAVFS